MNPGFWHSNFYPTNFWHENFWQDFGGLTTTAVHIFSTASIDPNHVTDSGNNVLVAGDVEVQANAYASNVLLPDDGFIILGNDHNEAFLVWDDASNEFQIGTGGALHFQVTGDIWLEAFGDTKIGDVSNYINVDSSGVFTFIGTSAIHGLFIQTTRVTSSPYAVLRTDDDIFVDTDGGAITVNLPAGIDGKKYRIINTGSAGNDVTVAPNGAELLTGDNASRTLSDSSVIILTYESTEGWW